MYVIEFRRYTRTQGLQVSYRSRLELYVKDAPVACYSVLH
jgi:hypothetical protein